MKKTLLLTALIALTGASIASAQCCGANAAKKTEAAKVEICAKCGEAKGAEACCKKDAAACAACGLHAGSPGCKAACKK